MKAEGSFTAAIYQQVDPSDQNVADPSHDTPATPGGVKLLTQQLLLLANIVAIKKKNITSLLTYRIN
jgi:hypothetical protein